MAARSPLPLSGRDGEAREVVKGVKVAREKGLEGLPQLRATSCELQVSDRSIGAPEWPQAGQKEPSDPDRQRGRIRLMHTAAPHPTLLHATIAGS